SAVDGDWVRVKVERGSDPLRGHVLEVMGDVLEPAKLVDLVVAELGLSEDFPDAVKAEAEELPSAVRVKDKKDRMDLTHLPFVTIDGEDAKDFDDAICIVPRGDGFEAWVAIADVAHYIQPGSALDEEALERSNSFYFPDRVVPMLPEKLSNGLCSLKPKVNRLAMVVRMRMDSNGKRRSIQVYDALIFSQARLTYTQVAKWLEDNNEKAVKSADVRQMLLDAERLFHIQEKRRAARGALDLDMPESRAVIKDQKVASIDVSERNIAHRLIEEMMLAANTAVAEFFEKHESAVLYRTHPAPEDDAIMKVNDFLSSFGLHVRQQKTGSVKSKDVQQVLEQSEGKPHAHVLHRLVLRSLQQAKYSPNNEGHFGLAYNSYCHFTSPIRRYADLTVHRRLKALINKENPDSVQPADNLAAIGLQTSTQERKQQRAEWDTQAMLAALYHSKDVGQNMTAMISGLTKRRVFLELESTLAEASMDVDALGGSFTLDEQNHRLVANRGGRMINLGDTLEVTIDSTDPVRGNINVSLIG
ncbi:MAG: VacB/RNase II family 3'-5' exoribonuclease, partial [Mariprofundaceae bacterium]